MGSNIATYAILLALIVELASGKAFSCYRGFDRYTGQGTSVEVSTVPPSSNLQKSIENIDDREILRMAQKIIQGYPKWLASFPVTFGLLGAKTEGRTTHLKFLGMTMLSFGETNGQRVSYHSTSPLGHAQKTSKCTVSLPILEGRLVKKKGGALSLIVTRNQSFDSTECQLRTNLMGYYPSFSGRLVGRIWHTHVMKKFHRHCYKTKHQPAQPQPLDSSLQSVDSLEFDVKQRKVFVN